MASIKEATKNAIEFARDVLGPERAAGLQLEEIDSANVDGADVWLITLSMLIPPPEDLSGIGSAFSAIQPLYQTKRAFKTFTVRKDTGEVVSMKIRELANA